MNDKLSNDKKRKSDRQREGVDFRIRMDGGKEGQTNELMDGRKQRRNYERWMNGRKEEGRSEGCTK